MHPVSKQWQLMQTLPICLGDTTKDRYIIKQWFTRVDKVIEAAKWLAEDTKAYVYKC